MLCSSQAKAVELFLKGYTYGEIASWSSLSEPQVTRTIQRLAKEIAEADNPAALLEEKGVFNQLDFRITEKGKALLFAGTEEAI